MPEFDLTPTYVVLTEFKKGVPVEIYKGKNYDSAVKHCNFWDERQNTYLHKIEPPETPLGVANYKFDELIKRLNYA